jgi:WD40-like Beta Propeller Repeat
MKKNQKYLILAFALLSAAVLYTSRLADAVVIETYTEVNRPPGIRPDYTGLVIPPNIAPLNFLITEPGTRYYVKIHSRQGESIEITGKKPRIIIPPGAWQKLLEANRGKKILYDVYVSEAGGGWKKYRTYTNAVAREKIDGYLVYRQIKPIHDWWQNVGIYQRNLEDYDESEVLHGRTFGKGCVNCHTFLNNSPESMVIGVRSEKFGVSALMANQGEVAEIGTKFGYSAWHPSGRLIMYSINKVMGYYHTGNQVVRDVLDHASALCYYLVDSKTVKTAPAISNKERMETYPTWSPDGRHLYFCSAPILWPPDSSGELTFGMARKIRYDLMRISYEVETDKWGEPETMLSAEETGMNIMLPRISPDGRFLVFCMCDYGCFPIYQQSSDLYLMDLETGGYRKLAVNSEHSESWHSWSSNSRWIAFSSKRSEGPYTKSFISYVDETGNAYKPFVLPQEDPTFYDSFIKAYSVPELVTGPVRVEQMKLARAIRSPDKIEVDLPITSATPKAAETGITGTRYPSRE